MCVHACNFFVLRVFACADCCEHRCRFPLGTAPAGARSCSNTFFLYPWHHTVPALGVTLSTAVHSCTTAVSPHLRICIIIAFVLVLLLLQSQLPVHAFLSDDALLASSPYPIGVLLHFLSIEHVTLMVVWDCFCACIFLQFASYCSGRVHNKLLSLDSISLCIHL
jgi:hypothetical protein